MERALRFAQTGALSILLSAGLVACFAGGTAGNAARGNDDRHLRANRHGNVYWDRRKHIEERAGNFGRAVARQAFREVVRRRERARIRVRARPRWPTIRKL